MCRMHFVTAALPPSGRPAPLLGKVVHSESGNLAGARDGLEGTWKAIERLLP
jgi:hypothetical protein